MKEIEKIEALDERIKHFEDMRDENGTLTTNEQEIFDSLKSERKGYGKICDDCGGTGKQKKTVDTDDWCLSCGGTGTR